MSARANGSMRGGPPRWRGMLLRATLAAGLAWTGMAVAGEGGRTPQPQLVIESAEACIAPPAEMRRKHPHLLAQQKKLTVRAGVRGTGATLAGCISCHASRDDGSVIGTDRNFCQSCHSFVAVRLDCFDCHQPAPARHGERATPAPITPLAGGEGAR